MKSHHLLLIFFTNAVIVITIFAIFFALGMFFFALIKKIAHRVSNNNRPLIKLLARIVLGAFAVIGLITALGSIGVNTNALVTSLGLVSVGLGLALKDVLSNALAGILVLLYQPIVIGNSVKIGDKEISGVVSDIDLHCITLQAGKNKIIVPNVNLFTNSITILNANRFSGLKEIDTSNPVLDKERLQ